MLNSVKAAALALALSSTSAYSAQLGVNLGGGETDTKDMPGRLYYNYTYPSKSDVDLAYSHGVRIFRLPLREDRVQNGFNGPLRPEVSANIYPIIDYIRSKSGAIVIIDWHSFGGRLGIPYGTGAWNDVAIADLNTKFLAPYKSAASNVWVDLQNEPGNPVGYWSTQNSVVKKLRAAGYTGTIVIEGTGYSAANTWATTVAPNIKSVSDPLKNLVFSPHQYFDTYGSGTLPTCVAGSETRIDPAIQDAQKQGYKILFGEMGWGTGANCAAVRSAVMKRLRNSPAVIGFTAWTLGGWYPYPNYIYGLRTSSGTTSVLFDGLLNDWNSASLVM